MPRTSIAQSYKLVPTDIPERKSIYRDMVSEFLESGEDSVRVEGEVVDKLKTSTLVTSLTSAAHGKGIMVRKVNEAVYLKRKPVKTS
jgi:hypothetical protein